MEQPEELEKKYMKFLHDTYQKILLRKPDKEAINYFLPMLKNKTKTMEELKEEIKNSEEATNIRNFTHYSDSYWNYLDEVKKYLNKLSTGDKNTDYIDDMPKRFKDFLPFKEVLVAGCGNGWLERRLYDKGIGLHFDAFDISEEYLKEAKSKRGERNIDYLTSDINEMKNIPKSKYDAVFNHAILHHAIEVEYAVKKLAESLKPDGLIFNYEYVGPAQNQYSEEHVAIMKQVMSRMPERLQTKYPLRPPIQNFRVEPTEAIHSDQVRPMIEKYFDLIYQRELNGGVAYQILWNNIEAFKNKSDNEAAEALKVLVNEDLKLSQSNKIPILFWYGVGIPKGD